MLPLSFDICLIFSLGIGPSLLGWSYNMHKMAFLVPVIDLSDVIVFVYCQINFVLRGGSPAYMSDSVLRGGSPAYISDSVLRGGSPTYITAMAIGVG